MDNRYSKGEFSCARFQLLRIMNTARPLKQLVQISLYARPQAQYALTVQVL